MLLGLFVFCGAVGFIDDFLKVRRRNSGGLNKRGKLLGQLLVGATFGIVALYFPSTMLDPRAARPTPRRWAAPRSRSSAT